MSLASNKVSDKRVVQLLKVCDDNARSLLNHTLVSPLRVAGKDLHITSFRVCCRFNIVLNAFMWSRGSMVPS